MPYPLAAAQRPQKGKEGRVSRLTYASRYGKRRRVLLAEGRWESSRIPADGVVAHLRALIRAGRSRTWIARATGVPEATIHRLLAGQSTIARHNAYRLLALTRADRPRGKTWVPATGTKRRLEALACQGWSQVDIARLAGLNANTLSRVVRDSPRQVAAATADAVARVYLQLARLCRTDQTGRWVQARARKRGYLPPAAWTPWTIDDPRARPLPVEGWERG